MSGGYHIGSVSFVVGSWFFCKTLGSRNTFDDELCVQIGEMLFTMGCTIFLILTFIDMCEAHCGGAAGGEILEKHLFFWGSVVFEVGVVLHTPRMSQSLFNPLQLEIPSKLGIVGGTILFVFGSIIFSMSSFINALDLQSGNDIALSRWAICTCTSYMVGGMLFIMGSMAYLGPDVSVCAPWLLEVGNICYLLGSALYLTGDILGLKILIAMGCSNAILARSEDGHEVWRLPSMKERELRRPCCGDDDDGSDNGEESSRCQE